MKVAACTARPVAESGFGRTTIPAGSGRTCGSSAHPRITPTNTSAFSRVSAMPPIAMPSASHVRAIRSTVDQAPGQPQCQRDEEQVEHRLLDQRIEEDGRRVESQHEAGDRADACGEEAVASQAEQRARTGADNRLYDPKHRQAVAEDSVDGADEVRVERRLVEHVGSDPVAAGKPARPFVVAARIAHERAEPGRTAQQPDMQQAHDECHAEDGCRIGQERSVGAWPRRPRPAQAPTWSGGLGSCGARRKVQCKYHNSEPCREHHLDCVRRARCVPARCARAGGRTGHLHEGCGADRIPPLHHLPSSRRDRPVRAADLPRRAAAYDTDRRHDQAARHAPVEAGAGATACSRTTARFPPPRSRRCRIGPPREGPKATRATCRHYPRSRRAGSSVPPTWS